MPFLSKEIHDEHLKGYVITGCAVREKTIVYFCLRKVVSDVKASLTWDHDIETRFLVVNLAEGATPWGLRYLTGYNKPRIGIALKPIHQGLLVARNLDGQVSVLGGGAKFPDEFIDPRKNPSTWKIKTINGYAYSVGGSRNVYKRVDLGIWVKLDQGIPTLDYSSDNGFDDLDAFDEANMYAVGGMGDVWHFNGQSWRQMAFPQPIQLTTVTCAGDGWVYITSLGGLWRGRESTWEEIGSGTGAKDACWFNGQLWLASDSSVDIWNGSELVKPTQDGTPDGEPVRLWGGHMDARDGLLVVAGNEVAMAFDGSHWRTLIEPSFD